MEISRRDFLRVSGSAAAALLASGSLVEVLAQDTGIDFAGYGPLIPDPDKVLDLPEGFKYQILARSGEIMTDGFPRPSLPDGMAAFPGPGGTVVLCCNHENDQARTSRFPVMKPGDVFDARRGGGTTALVVSRENKVLLQYATSAGTARNCAGGPTPWGTWLTCEEVEESTHGWVFEVDPLRAVSRRLPALGRFSHEAVAYDPRTGILYLTEDRDDGLLYRFRPAEGRPGQFEAGVLEALAIREVPSRFDVRRPYEVAWVPIANPDPRGGQMSTRRQGRQAGAVQFRRGEGAWFGHGSVYFNATTGGARQLGQVWRLTPGPQGDVLELFIESERREDLKNPDNVVVAPSGDLFICEDGSGADRLVGLTPNGKLFPFAQVRTSDAETAGACFSPDGKTLYFNIFDDGLTLAITGPFRTPPAGGGNARALPPSFLEPRVPRDYLLAALDRGYGKLEAAALHRLGLPLS